MGCFCRDALPPSPAPYDAARDAGLAVEPQVPLVAALATWLSRRWLPAAQPWAPDPAWLDLTLPEPPLPPAAMSVLLALAVARQTVMQAVQLDPLVPGDVVRLSRIVATLNRRTDALRPLAEDWRPWSALARLDGEVATVRTALDAGLFEPEQVRVEREVRASPLDPSLPAWRGLLSGLLGLAPLVALTATLRIELSDPDWAVLLGAAVRQLRMVALPVLADAPVVLRVLARNDAIGRLHAGGLLQAGGLEALPFREARQAVAARLRAVQARLPEGVRLEAGGLAGVPALLPNMSLVVNAPMVAAVAGLVLPRLDWQVPGYDTLPLLTSGGPAASLVKAMAALGPSPVRAAPCGRDCDAAGLTTR